MKLFQSVQCVHVSMLEAKICSQTDIFSELQTSVQQTTVPDHQSTRYAWGMIVWYSYCVQIQKQKDFLVRDMQELKTKLRELLVKNMQAGYFLQSGERRKGNGLTEKQICLLCTPTSILVMKYY